MEDWEKCFTEVLPSLQDVMWMVFVGEVFLSFVSFQKGTINNSKCAIDSVLTDCGT